MSRPARAWSPGRSAAWGLVAGAVTTAALFAVDALAVRNRPAVSGWTAAQRDALDAVATAAFLQRLPIPPGTSITTHTAYYLAFSGMTREADAILRTSGTGAVHVLSLPHGRPVRTLETLRPFRHVPILPWSLLDLDPWSDTVNSWRWARPRTTVTLLGEADRSVWTFAPPDDLEAAPIAFVSSLDGGPVRELRCRPIGRRESVARGEARLLDRSETPEGVRVRFVALPGPRFGVVHVPVNLHQLSIVSVSPDAGVVALVGWTRLDGSGRPIDEDAPGAGFLHHVLVLHERAADRTTAVLPLRPAMHSLRLAWSGPDEVWLLNEGAVDMHDRRTGELLRTRARTVTIAHERLVAVPDEGRVLVDDRVLELPKQLAARWKDAAVCAADTKRIRNLWFRKGNVGGVSACVRDGGLDVVVDHVRAGVWFDRFEGAPR